MNQLLDHLDKAIAQLEHCLTIKRQIEDQSKTIEAVKKECEFQTKRATKAEKYAALLEKVASNLEVHFENQYRRAEAAEAEVKALRERLGLKEGAEPFITIDGKSARLVDISQLLSDISKEICKMRK